MWLETSTASALALMRPYPSCWYRGFLSSALLVYTIVFQGLLNNNLSSYPDGSTTPWNSRATRASICPLFQPDIPVPPSLAATWHS
ncbi:hypothetical protein AMS68_001511 [Peltaster fructicola]|uniref:Uncharacterized protein n=1 Tax=Peltaster fructicola TaxID=286661 RepID=A0A6H0XMP2_9PEZI|nr:hypothetical protein AMS68_001511 [Peltaster fructicola]